MNPEKHIQFDAFIRETVRHPAEKFGLRVADCPPVVRFGGHVVAAKIAVQLVAPTLPAGAKKPGIKIPGHFYYLKSK